MLKRITKYGWIAGVFCLGWGSWLVYTGYSETSVLDLAVGVSCIATGIFNLTVYGLTSLHNRF